MEAEEELIDAPKSFDYGQLLVPDRVVVERATAAIRLHLNAGAENLVNAGKILIEVKEKLPHGLFEDWLGAEFFWSIRTAQNIMNVAEQFKNANFAFLNVSPSVLYLLSSKSTPAKVKNRLIPPVERGEKVTWKEVKEAIEKEKPKPPLPRLPKIPDPPPEILVERKLEIRREKAAGKFDHLPESIRPVFEEAVIFDELLNHLTQASKLFNQISGGNIDRDKGKPMACGTALAKDYQEGAELLKKLRHFISSRKPENVCVYCRGKNPKMKTCTACKGGGWSTAFAWRTATPNQREKENW